MVNILKTPVNDRSAWKGIDLTNDRAWSYQLTAEELDELRQATDRALRTFTAPRDIPQSDFPLPKLGRTLKLLRDEVEHGRWFVLIRGVPVAEYEPEQCKCLYAGLLAHLGKLVVQDTSGCLIDEVTNRGASYDQLEVRGYQTNACLTPHCDSGDIVALLCIQPAKEGGTSTIAGFSTVYNEILAKHPEYLNCLYRGFYYNIHGGGPPGRWQNVTRHRVPVYVYHQGRLSGRFNAKAIKTAPQLPNVAPLTELELAAVDCVADLAMQPDFRLDMDLQTGDLQLLCNHTVLHTRSAFADYEEPARRRLLLRAWINIPGGRELPLEFDDHYNTGPRQGTYFAVASQLTA